jgi:hypothetical protein
MSDNFCSLVGGNTRAALCGGKRKVPKKIVAGNKAFSSSEYADADTFQAAMLAAINLPAGNSSKLFPFPEIGEVADNTEAPTMGNLALGAQRRLRKGRPAYTYSVEISHEEYQKLLAFDGVEVPIFSFDDASQWWGYRAAAAANTINTNSYKGEVVYITVQGNGFEDGANAATGVATISVSYKSIDDFEKRGTYIKTPDMSAGDLVGLIDIMLYEPQAHASNVHKIKMSIPTAQLGVDLNPYDEIGVALAALTWTAGTGTNYGTALTITSVAVDATLKCLTVTFDSTAYTALASGAKIKLTPPNTTALIAGSITGFEIGSIILTK